MTSRKPSQRGAQQTLTLNSTISQAIKLDAYDPAKPLDITLAVTDAMGAISGNRIRLAATP